MLTNKITIFNSLKILVLGLIITCFFLFKKALLPLMVFLIVLYFLSKSKKYRSFEKDNETKISRWDGVLAIIAVIITVIGVIFAPSPVNNGKFNVDDVRQRMMDAGFTDEEIENRISLIESMEEPETGNKSNQMLSLLTEGNVKERLTRPGGNTPGGGLGSGMRTQNITPSINLISILSFINKGLIIIIGFGGIISALKSKTEYN